MDLAQIWVDLPATPASFPILSTSGPHSPAAQSPESNESDPLVPLPNHVCLCKPRLKNCDPWPTSLRPLVRLRRPAHTPRPTSQTTWTSAHPSTSSSYPTASPSPSQRMQTASTTSRCLRAVSSPPSAAAKSRSPSPGLGGLAFSSRPRTGHSSTSG